MSSHHRSLDTLRPRLPEYLQNIGLELHKNGTRLVGRCPVHDDRTPSFAVFGKHHETCGCHPCGFTGDVFALSEWLGRASSFPEAMRDVAAVLGVHVQQELQGSGKRPALSTPRPERKPEPPFSLSDSDCEKIHTARLAFSDAFHAGEPIIDEIATSLGFDRETLRWASWGTCGLGLANGWLCYGYPHGLKWRNPDPHAKPRFVWLIGKATAPWRMDWVKTDTLTIYVTEGESDTMALIAAGIEANGTAVAVASPGTSFSREWAALFQGKRVVFCFDTDKPGRTATATVAAMLKGHATEILTWKGTPSHV